MKTTPVLTLIEAAAQDGLREAGKEILARSNDLAPHLTGETEDSGFVAIDDLTLQVGYRSLVALLQHESLEYEHPRGGEYKFLESALAEVDTPAIIAKHTGAIG
ncbi:hypothetical protein EDF35_1935 [Rathayibacter sp. PhB151]|uniref:hypothetical protein n=1 Tax=Rathayibacter sp. PhB151 TaxID=2485189 RepID=UPI001062B65F|nr:hypothetical protein [Rathayibacter sp. PhB151]TDX78721.1 hypothetical protein EDF35_1935 [Rathayibacter sp. PhB151]